MYICVKYLFVKNGCMKKLFILIQLVLLGHVMIGAGSNTVTVNTNNLVGTTVKQDNNTNNTTLNTAASVGNASTTSSGTLAGGPTGTNDEVETIIIIVYNSLGQQVSVNYNYNVTTGQLNVSNQNGTPMASGTYYIVVINKKKNTRTTYTLVLNGATSGGN